MQIQNHGFIGCVRLLSIDGAFRNPKDWKVNEVNKNNHLEYLRVMLSPGIVKFIFHFVLFKNYCCEDSIVIDACQMLDRCSPNPCEHFGVCRQTSSEFECNCDETGYAGATCHSCELLHCELKPL